MVYYSGSSKRYYDLACLIESKIPDSSLEQIHCFENFNLARAFAYKKAKQDNSVGVVIEITKESDFGITYDGYPILIGKLTPKNHKIHLLEDIDFTK